MDNQQQQNIALFMGIDTWLKSNWKILLIGALAGGLAIYYGQRATKAISGKKR